MQGEKVGSRGNSDFKGIFIQRAGAPRWEGYQLQSGVVGSSRAPTTEWLSEPRQQKETSITECLLCQTPKCMILLHLFRVTMKEILFPCCSQGVNTKLRLVNTYSRAHS